jgi:hypothetical protein
VDSNIEPGLLPDPKGRCRANRRHEVAGERGRSGSDPNGIRFRTRVDQDLDIQGIASGDVDRIDPRGSEQMAAQDHFGMRSRLAVGTKEHHAANDPRSA